VDLSAYDRLLDGGGGESAAVGLSVGEAVGHE